MDIRELVEKYLEQIEIEDTDFIPVNDAVSDAAYLLLNLPTEMLEEYQKLKCQRNGLPDGAEFWKETGLAKRLRHSGKYTGRGHASLNDILDYLEGDVSGNYQKLSSPERIRLDITEIPELHPE